MSDYVVSGPVPEFGRRVPGEEYVPRPGAYGLVFDGQGRLAVLQTPQGLFLPGGGCEGGETPEEALVREVGEECGLRVAVTRRVGEAAEYRRTAGHERGIRKDCVFFEAAVVGQAHGPTEADHTLLWLEPREAAAMLAHGSQRWAVRLSAGMSPEAPCGSCPP